MKLDRPGFALIIFFIFGGSIYEFGIEKTASAVLIVFFGLLLYRAGARQL